MIRLDRFAAALASAMQDHPEQAGVATVAALLERIFPYPLARRRLGIDASEDYEALLLRVVAEEDGVSLVTPPDAAELARVTMLEKLPDLTVLQLVRGATVQVLVPAAPPEPVASAPTAEPETRWQRPADIPPPVVSVPEVATACWHCREALPQHRRVNFCPQCGADQRPPVCTACGESLERGWRHCPDCGAPARAGRPTPP